MDLGESRSNLKSRAGCLAWAQTAASLAFFRPLSASSKTEESVRPRSRNISIEVSHNYYLRTFRRGYTPRSTHSRHLTAADSQTFVATSPHPTVRFELLPLHGMVKAVRKACRVWMFAAVGARTAPNCVSRNRWSIERASSAGGSTTSTMWSSCARNQVVAPALRRSSAASNHWRLMSCRDP
jgi:hypothetical protein